MPGLYELGLPNLAVASGRSVKVMLRGAADLLEAVAEIELEVVDNQSASFGLTNLDAQVSSLATAAALAFVQADTDNLQARLPAALVGGRIDASVGAMAANTITSAAIQSGAFFAGVFAAGALNAAALASDAGDEIAAAVRTNLATELARLDIAISTRLATSSYTAPDSAATIAAAVRTNLATELARLDAAVTTRLATAGYTAPDNATIAAIAAFVDTEVAAILAAVDTEVAAIKAKTDNLPASPAAVGSVMLLDPSQALADGQVEGTVGYALVAAEADAAGDWSLVGTTLTLKRKNGSTFITFILDNATAPTSRVA